MRMSKEEKLFKQQHKFGLCLSGGGARGFAYLGVFKALEEHGIKFDMVAGTSVGALFGAMYCAGLTNEQIYKYASELKISDIKKVALFPSRLTGLESYIDKCLPVKRLEDFKIPFFAVAVDLKTGKEIDFSSGDVAPILAGSCAVPWVFYPVKYKDMNLVDGMVLNNIPVDVLLRNGCDYVVSVDCDSGRVYGTKSNNAITQLFACLNMMLSKSSSKLKQLSDVIIDVNLQKYPMLNVSKREEIIQLGYEAAIKKMPEIKALFKGKLDTNN